MRNAQVCVLWLNLNAVDGLDSVRDIGEVDKGAVPEDNNQCQKSPSAASQHNALLPEEIDQLDIPKLAKVPL
jgi:hypothetical protein